MATAKKINLTDEQQKTIKRMLWQTWEYIGDDIMQAVQAEGKYSIPADDLIEVVLDADHMKAVVRKPEEKDALAIFDNLPYKDRIKFAKTVFPANRYS